MPKVVVYVESPEWLGHAESQQENYVKALLSLGWKVIILTPAPQQTGRWAQELDSSQQKNLYIHLLSERPKSCWVKSLKWRWVNNQVRQAENQSGWTVDIVFLSWFDGMKVSPLNALMTRFVFKYPWAGLYFLPSHFRPDVKMKGLWKRLGKISKILADYILLRFGRCKGIGVLDEAPGNAMVQMQSDAPVVFFPQMTETKIASTTEIETIRQQANGRCIFALLGHLHPRKGLIDFLRIARESDPARNFFLLVGKFNIKEFPSQEQQEIMQLLQTTGRDNCIFKLMQIESPREFNGFVESCDVLYLVYKNFYHSSGLLAKAALFNKPVIVSRSYCMGERVEKYKLGITVDSNNYREIVSAVNRLGDAAYRSEISKGEGFAEYHAQNTTAALQTSLQQLLAAGIHG